jgi:long-subunit acyl-CoA synthetase (AMP-forming)
VILRHTPLLTSSEMQKHALDLSTVKGMMSGGASVPAEVIEGVYHRTGIMIQMSMGTTETISTSGVRSTTLEHSLSEGNLGSSGLVFDGAQIRIAGGASKEEVDRWQKECEAKRAAGERVPLGPGAPGEILIGGDTVMLGYYSGKGAEEGGALDAEATKGAFTLDGLYRTGDEGMLDAKGNLWITGRIKVSSSACR